MRTLHCIANKLDFNITLYIMFVFMGSLLFGQHMDGCCTCTGIVDPNVNPVHGKRENFLYYILVMLNMSFYLYPTSMTNILCSIREH